MLDLIRHPEPSDALWLYNNWGLDSGFRRNDTPEMHFIPGHVLKASRLEAEHPCRKGNHKPLNEHVVRAEATYQRDQRRGDQALPT